MKRKICYQIPETEIAFGITLYQLSKNRFEVVYGKQTDTNLSYTNAALELGAAIMHALACDGKLSNE